MYAALPTERTRALEKVYSVISPENRADAVIGCAAGGGGVAAFKARYRSDPVGFVEDCIDWSQLRGKEPTPYQKAALKQLQENRRLAVRGPHGLGKTALASWVILWFALTRDGEDWKLPTTASAWRQLTKFLWPEVKKWARLLKWDSIGRSPFDRYELLTLNLKLETGEAFAVASDTPELIEGAHADNILYIFDESKAIQDATFDAAEGAFSTGDAYALAISTPGEPNGRFYDIHKRRPGYEDWAVIHVTLEQAIEAGRISQEWAEQRKRQWGETSAVYQNRVLGNFAASDEDGVIPLAWIEAANERWHAVEDWGDFICVGVDVARSGNDSTERAMRYTSGIKEILTTNKEDTMQTAGRVVGILRGNGGYAMIDLVGLGAGTFDRVREQGFDARPFNAGERTDKKDVSGELGFTNKRSAAWWNMRELLDPANDHNIALPEDDELTGDLTAPKWCVMSGGKIQVESKDDIRKRIGRSTNKGDGVIQAFWQDEQGTTWDDVKSLGSVDRFTHRWG